MSFEHPQVHLKIERRSLHPWIFQKMVEKPATKPKGGSIVDIHDKTGAWVARGIYNGHSRIALRVLTENQTEEIGPDFFESRIANAVKLRRDVLKLDDVGDSYRLIHSEGDGLSGLVIDKFGKILVVEFFSSGMYRFFPVIKDALLKFYSDAEIYWFAEEHVQKQESMVCRSPEPPKPFEIVEHGLKFKVAPGSKHKTGFFLDQRENRKALAELTEGKSVLDICCNSGGFAVYAKALGKAEEVVALDLDEEVIELAKQNAKLNRADIKFVRVDLFHWLRELQQTDKRFDVVILDPAKQTRSRDEVEMALRRYTDMNRLSIQAVKPGGLFVSCSCTGLVREEEFIDSIRRAGRQAGRNVQVFRVTGAASDHPFLAHVPESRYLKAVWARVW